MPSMPINIDTLLIAVSRIAVKYPDATIKWALNYPDMWIMFVVGDDVVAQFNVKNGELRGDM